MNIEAINSVNFWNDIHRDYDRDTIKVDGWLDVFSDIIDNCDSPILDLGCGSGNDTLYLINKGKKVYAADQSENAIKNIEKNFPEIVGTRILNMLDGIDYPDDTVGIVVADLSLHYFTMEETKRILQDIKRILKSDGYLLIRVNSINDVNHGAGAGEEIEHHLYRTNDGMFKRFFDEEDIKTIFSDFNIYFCEEQRMLRYKNEKIVYCVGMRNC
ncbi:MAG: class I SAM-dependent methyltransferase [Saccharofermentans sp.]|nr:class I SAM-dependent methyltransferase [Saccharofermentans sp.]